MSEKVHVADMLDWVSDKLRTDEVAHEFHLGQGQKPWPKQEKSIKRGAAVKQFLNIVAMAPDEFRDLSERVLNRGGSRRNG